VDGIVDGEPLRAGRAVLDLLSLAQGFHRSLDGQQDRRFNEMYD
jgi:hypothetical protein